MTINETLTIIFSTKKAFEKVGIPENTWNGLRKRFRDKNKFSDKLGRSIITKFGCIKVQDEQWELPK